MPWGIVLLLTALNVVNFYDRYVVAAVLPAIGAELHLTDTEAGLLFSAFVPGYVIFSPIFGYFGDRMNRPRLMVVGVVLWSFATLAGAYVHSFALFIAARILVGAGEASFGAIGPAYIRSKIENPVLLNSALSIFYFAVPFGSALGYMSGGRVASEFSWRAAFLVGAIPGLLLALPLLRLKDTVSPPKSLQSPMKGIREVLGRRILWLIFFGYILNSIALNGVATFLTKYGVSIGFELAEIGWYFGLFLLIGGVVGTLVGGQIASLFARRYSDDTERSAHILLKFAGIVALFAGPILFLSFRTLDHSWFLIGCLTAEVLIFASLAPVNTAIVIASPPALVSLTQAASILAINVFGALPAPVITGKLGELYSLPVALQSLSVFLIGSGVVWFLVGVKGQLTYGSKGARRKHK